MTEFGIPALKERWRTLVLILAAIALSVTGCSDTAAERRRISQHTKDLAAKVKADPTSPEGQAAMNELIEILDGDWSFASSQACYVLDDLGPLAAPAVRSLMRASQSDNRFVRQAGVRGLRSVGPKAAPAVDILIQIVENSTTPESSKLRTLYAIEALGNIGEPAIRAIPTLERATRLQDEELANQAQEALEKLRTSNKDKLDVN